MKRVRTGEADQSRVAGLPKLLAVDDDASILYAFRRCLEPEGFEVLSASTVAEARHVLERHRPVAVFADYSLPDGNGCTVLEEAKERYPGIPSVLFTGVGEMDIAVRAMQAGAWDYLPKPLSVDRLLVLARQALKSTVVRGPEHSGSEPEVGSPPIVGHHPGMQEVYKFIGLVCARGNRSTVLIHGETGTGKEMVARVIHGRSITAGHPFVTVDCGLFPGTLLESELFGHEKGAFTGAMEQRRGKLESAGEGTVFLDEIADAPLPTQQKLLRVLETREVERLGGNQVRSIGARFVVATRVPLAHLVASGHFRQDLFYRISVLTCEIPPLRSRGADMLLLADYFLEKFQGGGSKSLKRLSPEARAALIRHSFPGNVRELRNIIERAMLVAPGDVIEGEHLTGLGAIDAAPEKSGPPQAWSQARARALHEFEERYLRSMLVRTRGFVTRAAREAGISRQSFQRLMNTHGLKARDFRHLSD